MGNKRLSEIEDRLEGVAGEVWTCDDGLDQTEQGPKRFRPCRVLAIIDHDDPSWEIMCEIIELGHCSSRGEFIACAPEDMRYLLNMLNDFKGIIDSALDVVNSNLEGSEPYSPSKTLEDLASILRGEGWRMRHPFI